MKKLILTVIVCALTICLLVVPVSAATNVSGENASSDLFLPLAFVEEGSAMRYGVCMISPTNSVESDLINGAYPYYYSKNAVGSFQFANLMENYKRVYGYLRSYALQFEIINGFIEKGDTFNFKTVVALQYAYGEYEPRKGYSGDYLAIGVYSNGERVGEIPITVTPVHGDMTNIGWQYYSIETNGLYNGADGDQLRFEIQVSALQPSSYLYNLNAIGVQFSKDSVYAAGSGAKAPIYNGPDTSKADELTSAEDKLMNDTAQGREDAESILSADSFMDTLSGILPGVLAATEIMDLCFNTIAPLQTLVYIGLALGFVSFVLGMVNMVVGSVRAENRRKERERRRK